MQKPLSPRTIIHQDPLETAAGFTPDSIPQKAIHRPQPATRPFDLRSLRLPKDLSARLTDGLVPALLLLALTLMMDMLIHPIKAAANLEGLLIYLFLVLAMGVFALEKSTHLSGLESGRAIAGMVAGQFFWHSLYIIQLLGGIDLNGQGTVLILVLVGLVGITLWKPVLPLGVKFFLLTFMASWVNRFFINHSIEQSAGIDFFTGLFYGTGFLALVGLIIGIAYLVFRAEFKVQRLWAALGIWQAALVTIIVALKVFL